MCVTLSDHAQLTWDVCVSCCQIDMEEIKAAYEEMYEVPLVEAVESECSGDYKKLLLAILNPPA